MLVHTVRARRSSDDFPRAEHLAAKIAEVAADPVAVEPETVDVVEPAEQRRFLSAVDSLAGLEAGALDSLNVVVDPRVLDSAPAIPPGIFR
jgi:hypothetical protein